jgi:predicted nuclease of restriction endonuclease-like (RecB) superfamily
MSDLGKHKPEIQLYSNELFVGISHIIEKARNTVALYLNAETTLLYWNIGNYININLKNNNRTEYGAKILATVSQELTSKFGKGYSYSALTRMCKAANAFDSSIVATLSQQLSWSHLIELATIPDETKRNFYSQLSIYERWDVRQLRNKIDAMLFERTAIAAKPEDVLQQALVKLENENILSPDLVFKSSYILDFMGLQGAYNEKELENALVKNIESFLLELGSGFAFVERQKRISVDSIDYHLDLLFYHRKLKRLVAIDLKLGRFKPEHKAQMELYLRWLQKNEMQPGEETPIGLLLCSEGNSEHIELLMLDHNHIKVAQYLTELPSKQWFAEKLHRAIEIANQNTFKHDSNE